LRATELYHFRKRGANYCFILKYRPLCVCLPGEGGSQLVGVPDLAVDHGVEDRQQKEGEEVEEDQVEPVDVDL
jgi:hypothetical protein